MAKIMLTDKEKTLLRLYIDFEKNDASPCKTCIPHSRMACTGCCEKKEWLKRKEEYKSVGELLQLKAVRDYVETSVAVNRISGEIKELEKRKTELETVLEKCEKELNLVDGDKWVKLYCDRCDLSFTPLKENCKLYHHGATRKVVGYYYNCPICDRRCFSDCID